MRKKLSPFPAGAQVLDDLFGEQGLTNARLDSDTQRYPPESAVCVVCWRENGIWTNAREAKCSPCRSSPELAGYGRLFPNP